MFRSVLNGVSPRLFAALLLVSAPFLTLTSDARADSAVVGEITAAQQDDAAATIKTTLTDELAKLKLPAGAKVIVSANLVKLEAKKDGTEMTTHAEVSLAIRDAKTGLVRGIVNGTGLIKTRSSNASTARMVVEAATRGATRNVAIVLGG